MNNDLYCGVDPGGVYLWNSGDSTWIQYSNTPKDVNKLTFFNNEIFCATSHGPFSLDSTGGWHSYLEGLMHRTISSMDTCNGITYICADEELFSSSDQGETFEKMENGSGREIFTTDSMYYLLSYTGVFTSVDSGSTWDTILSGTYASVRDFSITPDYYYALKSGKLWRSAIDSIQMELLENNIQEMHMKYVEAIDSVVIACVTSNTTPLYISRDFGLSFEPLNLTGWYVGAIQKYENRFLILFDVPYFSDDLGLSWNEIPVPDTLNYPIFTMDQSQNNFAIGGLQNFLWITDNWGNSWTALQDNLPSSSFNAHISFVSMFGNRIFTSPVINSLWYRDDIITGITDNEVDNTKHAKLHLYPNPVVDVITLEIESVTENSQFRILDIQGREQITGTLNTKKTNIDLGKLKPGIYIIEILTTSGKTSRKLIKY